MAVVFQNIGPYAIEREIGHGMSTVLLATDTRSQRRVALKLVRIGTDRDTQDVVDAERLGARLQEQFCKGNAYVPEVYEYGTEGGYFYIAMEYLDGQDLSEVLTRGALVPSRAVGIAIQLCDFLDSAHRFETTIDGKERQSLLHGDLKPTNIRLLPGDHVKVLDFGIAKALSLTRKVTRNDFGSVPYMSPERLDSIEMDAHADFWAVGVLLYEMVKGEKPFQAPESHLLKDRIRSRRPPASVEDRCPIALQAIVAKLLAPAAADRYPAASAIRADLEAFAAARLTEAEREGWPARAYDEPATHRTHRPVDQEATRRSAASLGPTTKAGVLTPVAAAAGAALAAANAVAAAAKPGNVPPSAPASGTAMPATPVAPTVTAVAARPKRKRFRRFARAALFLWAIFVVAHEIWVAAAAQELSNAVAHQDLDSIGSAWARYETLRSGSLNIAVGGLERALVRQTRTLTDRVIGSYHDAAPAAREPQWLLARDALTHAVRARPGDEALRAALRFCEGHLHEINGEARKVERRTTDAQREFSNAVTAFREAAELRPNWPDPFLGLMRTFIYGMEDVDRGADALKQAEGLGYTPGSRETAQLADGFRVRAESFVRTARRRRGQPEELEALTRGAEAYRQALDLYNKIPDFGDTPRHIANAQRGLAQIEQRMSELAQPPVPSATPLPPAEVRPWA